MKLAICNFQHVFIRRNVRVKLFTTDNKAGNEKFIPKNEFIEIERFKAITERWSILSKFFVQMFGIGSVSWVLHFSVDKFASGLQNSKVTAFVQINPIESISLEASTSKPLDEKPSLTSSEKKSDPTVKK